MSTSTSARGPWALVAAFLGLVAILTAGAVLIARQTVQAPVELLEKGRELARDLRSVAEALPRWNAIMRSSVGPSATPSTSAATISVSVIGAVARSASSAGRRRSRSTTAT